MPFCPQPLIDRARASIADMEAQFGVRVVHAAIGPAQPSPLESMGEEYQMRVAFVRPVDAYLGVDHELPIERGHHMMEGAMSTVRIFALDIRDAYAQASSDARITATAALSPYMDNFGSDMLVKNAEFEAFLTKVSAVGPKTRAGLRSLLEMHVTAADAAVQSVLDGRAMATDARVRSALGRGHGALALGIALAGGNPPAPEHLPATPGLQSHGMSPLSFADASDVQMQVNAWESHKQQARQQVVATPGATIGFGVAIFGAPEQIEGQRGLAAQLNAEIRSLIQNAVPSHGGADHGRLAQSAQQAPMPSSLPAMEITSPVPARAPQPAPGM